jgi:hypothetical protein
MELSELETTLEAAKPVRNYEVKEIAMKPLYKGLAKLAEESYQGGTSIKYWM